VNLICDGQSTPIDLDASYWYPSGNQQVPAVQTGGIDGGLDELGPAIVVFAKQLAGSAVLPTNANCGFTFDPSVVDKKGLEVCAPPGGDYTQACTPGDTSLIAFKTEPMTIQSSDFQDNDTGYIKTQPLQFQVNVPFSAGALAAITMTENGAAYTTFTVTSPLAGQLAITPMGGSFAANALYVITFPATFTDTFGHGPPAPIVFHVTTGP